MQPATRLMKRSWPALLAVGALLVGAHFGGSMAPSASAQVQPGVPVTSPPFNASEQRVRMIAQLEQINRRLQDIEMKLASGINVKVTDMPAVVVKDQAGK